MRAALVVAHELLHCRLAEGGGDALLSHVSELLDAAYGGTMPFRIMSASRTPQGACAHTKRVYSPLREEPGGPHGGSSAYGITLPTQRVHPQGAGGAGGFHLNNNEESLSGRQARASEMVGGIA